MVQCPGVVVGRGSESGNVALRVRFEGSCLTILLHLVKVKTCFLQMGPGKLSIVTMAAEIRTATRPVVRRRNEGS